MEFHLTATECHLPYGITHCYLPPDTSERAPPNPSQTGRYSIYLPERDGRLSWPRWLVTFWDSLPVSRQVTHPSTNRVQCRATTWQWQLSDAGWVQNTESSVFVTFQHLLCALSRIVQSSGYETSQIWTYIYKLRLGDLGQCFSSSSGSGWSWVKKSGKPLVDFPWLSRICICLSCHISIHAVLAW